MFGIDMESRDNRVHSVEAILHYRRDLQATEAKSTEWRNITPQKFIHARHGDGSYNTSDEQSPNLSRELGA